MWGRMPSCARVVNPCYRVKMHRLPYGRGSESRLDRTATVKEFPGGPKGHEDAKWRGPPWTRSLALDHISSWPASALAADQGYAPLGVFNGVGAFSANEKQKPFLCNEMGVR